MATVHVRARYGLALRHPRDTPQGKAEFEVPGERPVWVVVDGAGGRCEARTTLELDMKTLAGLQASSVPEGGHNYEIDTDHYPPEAGRLLHLVVEALRTALSHVKYRLSWHDMDTALLGSTEPGDGVTWSTDESAWYSLPTPVGGVILMRAPASLTAENEARIQTLIAAKKDPLEGWEHLHRAFNQNSARGIYIDATIAAELAIKEYLSRRLPTLQVILDNLPSPPLEKLYGEVLRNVDGRDSLQLKQIREGQRVRNRLLHRPHAPEPDLQDAFDYVKAIEDVLTDLQARLDEATA